MTQSKPYQLAEYGPKGSLGPSFDTIQEMFSSPKLDYYECVLIDGEDATEHAAKNWANQPYKDLYEEGVPDMFFPYLTDDFDGWKRYHLDGEASPDTGMTSVQEDADIRLNSTLGL